MVYKRICLVVLDSVGIGEQPDAATFGDEGANTLGHIGERVKDFALPNLQRMGLGLIAPIPGVLPVDKPIASYGKMREVSAGKDTMTGHWEIMGLRVDVPFITFPNGFPDALIRQFEDETGRRVIGNKPASGTEILDELGEEQMQTGAWIVYTSADSVFQLAAHEGVIPLDELYRGCEIARRLTLEHPYTVGRVIARPYVGTPGAFQRTSNRHDYAVKPPAPTVMNRLNEADFACITIGKIRDIYSGEGVTQAIHTTSNADGIDRTMETMRSDFHGLVFTNLVDFDSLYGHRRDPQGYGEALMAFDQRLPDLLATLRDDDLLILTADHGNDPVHSGTDHTREYVPLLAWSPSMKRPQSLGVRGTFADVGATIADNFQLEKPENGTSFLREWEE
jgi:phosphopentomutase